MKYNFNKEVNRTNTDCLKHDKLNDFFGTTNLVPLWIADTDYETPDFVLEAIKDRLSHPVLGYSSRNEAYYNSIINWTKSRNNWDIKKEWIGFTPGVVAGVGFALKAVSKIGDRVLIQPPVYTPFFHLIDRNERELVENVMKCEDGKWQIDFEDFEEKVKDVKAFILCNPHNPTGRVFTREELTKMGELCVKHNVCIISDEIHSDLTLYGNQHINIASLSKEIGDITITISAPSKTFNIAGLATSYSIITNPELRAKMDAEKNKFHIEEASILGAVALQSAFENGEDWLRQCTEYITGNIDLLVDYIEEFMPKIKVYRPESTFLMWLDMSGLGYNPEQLNNFIYKNAKLALNPGLDYGSGGAGYMRINIGTQRKVIIQALEQLRFAYISAGFNE